MYNFSCYWSPWCCGNWWHNRITLYMLKWLGPIKYNDFDTIVMMIIGFTISTYISTSSHSGSYLPFIF